MWADDNTAPGLPNALSGDSCQLPCESMSEKSKCGSATSDRLSDAGESL